MPTKIKELNNLKDGDRERCSTCNPSKKRIRENQVWAFVQRTGLYPWKVKEVVDAN